MKNKIGILIIIFNNLDHISKYVQDRCENLKRKSNIQIFPVRKTIYLLKARKYIHTKKFLILNKFSEVGERTLSRD